MPMPSATMRTCTPMCTPSSTKRASGRDHLAHRRAARPARSPWPDVAAVIADLLVPAAARSTCSPTGFNPACQPRVEIPAKILLVAGSSVPSVPHLRRLIVCPDGRPTPAVRQPSSGGPPPQIPPRPGQLALHS